MIGTSSSSSTEAWLVHPEPDTWLALSASTTTSLGLDGVSPTAPGEEGTAGADEEEGAASELEDAAAASGASALAASL